MESSSPEHWSGEAFASPGDLPNPGIEPGSPALQVDSLPTELSGFWKCASPGPPLPQTPSYPPLPYPRL